MVVLQLVTITASGGDVYLLGEAYAFGVVWSFFFKSLGVLVLRFKRSDQEYKTPFNLRFGRREVPLGLITITLALFLVACANLFTKQVATIFGLLLTLLLFVVFTVSERRNTRKRPVSGKPLEEFNLVQAPQLQSELLDVGSGCVLVAVRDYLHLEPLAQTLAKPSLCQRGIVVVSVRPLRGEHEYELGTDQLFTDYEQRLFSSVVKMAEGSGQSVGLLVVPGIDPYYALAQAATNLRSSRLVLGASNRISIHELARRVGLAWEKLPPPHHVFTLEIVGPNAPPHHISLGPHRPGLRAIELEQIHEIWLELSEDQRLGAELHHRHIVALGVQRLYETLCSGKRDEIVKDLREMIEAENSETTHLQDKE